MTSSVLTSSQSGIVSEGGRKVLKTRIQILGRYLLKPGEELNSDVAAKLTDKAKSGRARLRTQLKLFKTGIRLGEHGVFNSMPVEFVQYPRLSDLVSPAKHPSVLVMAVKDYQQRCATIMQFKDDVCLRVVVDVINRHRRFLDEDVARMSDLQSVSSTMRRGAAATGHREGQQMKTGDEEGEGNWRLTGFKPTEASSSTASNSMLDDDYAVIRRSRMLASSGTESAINKDEAAPVQRRWEQWQLTDVSQEDSLQLQEQHQERYQKKPQHQQPNHHQGLRHQQPQQRCEMVSTNETPDFDDLETAAIFETPDGPPTLLNELFMRGGHGGTSSGSAGNRGSENGRRRSSAVRISQLPSEFVARARVDRVASVASSNSGDRPPSAAWAPLDDRLGE